MATTDCAHYSEAGIEVQHMVCRSDVECIKCDDCARRRWPPRSTLRRSPPPTRTRTFALQPTS
eukprot:2647329-Heterocapsa_arctica.AAC.1